MEKEKRIQMAAGMAREVFTNEDTITVTIKYGHLHIIVERENLICHSVLKRAMGIAEGLGLKMYVDLTPESDGLIVIHESYNI